ncbi:MAG: hypothetical protein IJ173_05085 [Kiritimatiellae bacterium]|nr:hypothetical protein [Kiritimatiellia bacterium]
MKYAAYGLLAAFLALGVYGAIPTTAEGWYTPSGGFSRQSGSGTVWYLDDEGNERSVSVSVDGQGKVTGGMESIADTTLKTSYEALVKACANEAWNALQDEAIATIGKNLHNLGLADGIDIVGTDPNGNEHRYTMRFTPGSGIRDSLDDGSRPELTDPTAGWNMADEKTLHWRTNNKMELMGADTATSSTDEWWNDYGFFVPFLKGTGALGWKKYGGWYDGVFGTMTSDGRTMLTLAGWTGGHECSTDMNSILTEENGDNRANHYVLTRYGTGSDAVFHYVPFGDRLETGGGAPVDGVSITTNTTDGATTQGDASLYGWADADAESIPQKGDGRLKWTDPADMVDGISIGMTDAEGGGKVWEVKDAHVYAGQHAKHYFGTGNDKSAPLGWHELPNATTNRVEGDEVTISSDPNVPGAQPEEGLKRLGLRGWNYGWAGDPLFLVNQGGVMGYIPLPAITNLAACACTNKWNALLGWIQDGELNGEDGIAFSDSNLDQYLYGTLGYIYSTTADNLYFDNDGEQIQASFTAPENWADGNSVELTESGQYQIKGFADAGACGASVSAMLSDPTGSDATTHLMLAKKTDTGELHYVPMGRGVAGGGEHADGVTITTNDTQGAATQGLMSLYGWSSAQDGKVPMKKNNALVWEDAGTPPDDVTLAVTTEGSGAQQTKKLSIKGFSAAKNNSIPWKNDEGEFVWGGSSTVTNRILAGAGINITDNGGGAVTISAQSFDSGGSGGQTIVLSVITDIRYNEETHKFQCKRRTITFKGSVSDAPQEGEEWEDVFEAVSHKSEHEEGN